MHKPIKYVEKAVTVAAGAAWVVFDKLNQINQNPSFTPAWSDKPLLKSYEKQKPTLGWPRETDSLCPRCVPEIRQQSVDGKLPHEILFNEKVGEIKATIIERDGKILMVKECPIHGRFEDLMSIYRRSSSTWKRYSRAATFARTMTKSCTTTGTSTIKYGRADRS